MNAPMIAAIGNCWLSSGRSTNVMYATKLAPPVTPIVEGDAISLRITPCKRQPERARQIPVIAAPSVRGKRTFQIKRRAGVFSLPKSPCIISLKENFTVPNPTDKPIMSNADKKVITISVIFFVFELIVFVIMRVTESGTHRRKFFVGKLKIKVSVFSLL